MLVTDEADRGLQPRTFERLLGLDEGLLTPGPHTNTSLSMERIEFCRQVNLAVESRGWVGNKRLKPPAAPCCPACASRRSPTGRRSSRRSRLGQPNG